MNREPKYALVGGIGGGLAGFIWSWRGQHTPKGIFLAAGIGGAVGASVGYGVGYATQAYVDRRLTTSYKKRLLKKYPELRRG